MDLKDRARKARSVDLKEGGNLVRFPPDARKGRHPDDRRDSAANAAESKEASG